MLEFPKVIVRIFEFIILLTVHEWGHAKVANMLGDETAKNEGRLTLNPVAHIDPLGTVILPMIGMVFGGLFFGWAKPVPVDTRNLKNPKRDMMLIAGAGPLMNIVCTVAIIGVLRALSLTIDFPSASEPAKILHEKILDVIILDAALISVFLATFNMLPIFPLDGFSVVYGLLPHRLAEQFERSKLYGPGILMGLIFLPGLIGVKNPIFLFIWESAIWIFRAINSLWGF